MFGLLHDLPLMFAQDAGPANIGSTLLMMFPILLVVYVLLILPQQQQEKKRRLMLEKLRKNDKVLTTGGLYATVMSIDNANDKVVLRVDDERNVKLAFTRASVARVLESSDKPAESS